MQALSDEQHIATVEAKVDALAAKVEEGFDRADQGFDGVEKGFDRVDKGLAEMRTQIKASEIGLRSEINAVRSDARADFRTLLAVVVSLWAATVLTVLAAHL